MPSLNPFLARSKMNASTGLFITLVTTQGSLCLNTWRCFITGKGDIRLWAISAHRPFSTRAHPHQKPSPFFDPPTAPPPTPPPPPPPHPTPRPPPPPLPRPPPP